MKVSFGMYWEVYGRQTIELPDDINVNDKDAITEYIRENWDEVSLPSGEYVQDSDCLDVDSDFIIEK